MNLIPACLQSLLYKCTIFKPCHCVNCVYISLLNAKFGFSFAFHSTHQQELQAYGRKLDSSMVQLKKRDLLEFSLIMLEISKRKPLPRYPNKSNTDNDQLTHTSELLCVSYVECVHASTVEACLMK